MKWRSIGTLLYSKPWKQNRTKKAYFHLKRTGQVHIIFLNILKHQETLYPFYTENHGNNYWSVVKASWLQKIVDEGCTF